MPHVSVAGRERTKDVEMCNDFFYKLSNSSANPSSSTSMLIAHVHITLTTVSCCYPLNSRGNGYCAAHPIEQSASSERRTPAAL